MKILQVAKWLSSRKRTRNTTTVVLHHDGGTSGLASIKHLLKVGLSYHYIIERDGTIHKCVPAARVAFHAGVSNGPQGKDVNGYSIGICLSNRGTGEAYPKAQVEAAEALVYDLKKAIPSLRWITSHRLITKRKIDPAFFDFEGFCNAVNYRLGFAALEKWMDEKIGRGWSG